MFIKFISHVIKQYRTIKDDKTTTPKNVVNLKKSDGYY
jgi:hypothetical protein